MRRAKAELLPEGWNWEHYEDRSGCLRAPDGKSYFNYDLVTGEYTVEIGGNCRWYPEGLDMQEFRAASEELMRQKLEQEKTRPTEPEKTEDQTVQGIRRQGRAR